MSGPLVWLPTRGRGSQGRSLITPTNTYLRPDGTSLYNRPDGTSIYLRP